MAFGFNLLLCLMLLAILIFSPADFFILPVVLVVFGTIGRALSNKRKYICRLDVNGGEISILYYTGLLHERHAKTQLLVGYAPHTLLPLVEEAMRCFAEAEKIRPVGNDDSILRWNRCVRLLESRPDFHFERGPAAFDTEDMPPVSSPGRRAGGHH